jgi:allophanate hydrolase
MNPAPPSVRSLTISDLSAAYRARRTTPMAVVEDLYTRIAATAERAIWITPLPLERALEQAQRLAARDPASLPLYGIPFAIKDNIDLANVPTTVGCPAFAYTPAASAYVVNRLLEAGAIVIGKTNLDQFATGLVGTRSPYGICRNSFDPAYISGGSSSGSAVAVAMGLVSFALGTDTAGSGRVPAAFNNLIGLKPTCGRLSTGGVVPACRTLDAVSILALTAEDAALVCRAAEGYDAAEAYSRRLAQPTRLAAFAHGPFRFGVPRPDQLQFFGNDDYARLFEAAVAHLEQLGGQAVLIDLAPFLETAQLLYQGPWVAERYVVAEPVLRRDPDAVLAVTRQIIEGGARPSAVDAFRAQYRLQELRRVCEQAWAQIDVLLTPTAGTIYRIDEIEADPVRLNSQLGLYTNFVNLLDLAAVAVPAGFTPAGLPFGVTLVGPAWSDFELLRLAARLQRCGPARLGALPLPLGAAVEFDWNALTDGIALAVCGAHLQGLPLNNQLLERGAVLIERTLTAPDSRLYALPGGPPARPGLVRVAAQGVAIAVEIWVLPSAAFGSFIAGIPAPLAIGKLTLADGREVSGFLCEAHAVSRAQDISAYGGWRAYQASRPLST